jgi:hypothetical protein
MNHTETAIGVFSSRDRAGEAAKQLRERGVPEESIILLTRSESEAKNSAREFGASVGGFVGGAVGMSAGVAAATLLVPGLGPVLALGFGAARLAWTRWRWHRRCSRLSGYARRQNSAADTR